MINDVIKSQIAAGKNAAEVRTHLRSAGYTEAEIDSNMAAIKKAPSPPKKRTTHYWMIFTGLLLIFKGIGHYYQQRSGFGALFVVLGILNLFLFMYYKD